LQGVPGMNSGGPTVPLPKCGPVQDIIGLML